MNVHQRIVELITVFLLFSLVNCFSDEFDSAQLLKTKRKAMRNSLVRFGKRAGARLLLPFYDGSGALRSVRFNAPSVTAGELLAVPAVSDGERPQSNPEEGNYESRIALIRPSPLKFSRQIERYFMPPRYNLFRYRRADNNDNINDDEPPYFVQTEYGI